MPQNIQRYPPGLLSFLGIKGIGRAPAELADAVTPTLNIEHLYTADLTENVVSTLAGATTVGNNASVEVPVGQAWRILCLGATFSAPSAVGTVINGTILMRPPGSAIRVPLHDGVRRVAATVTERLDLATFVPQPFVVVGGTNFFAMLEENTGGVTTIEINLVVMIQRLLA